LVLLLCAGLAHRRARGKTLTDYLRPSQV
jgi:hypothetical protein